ncbi:caveolin-3-like [Haliotis cracherodii]|uniref:caveolin-3-like n=1 Tax=Haliotis cracherodii TaxID=6455 RepID=UPI0039E92DB5
MAEQSTIDLENRDPNNINDHLKVQFEDVLAEPEGAHSIDCCWKFTNTCFNCAFKCCYMLMTLCGPLYGLYYGWSYAMLACAHIWEYTPQIKACEINCVMMRKVYTICLNCCLTPCCESCGAVFSRIQVKQ